MPPSLIIPQNFPSGELDKCLAGLRDRSSEDEGVIAISSETQVIDLAIECNFLIVR